MVNARSAALGFGTLALVVYSLIDMAI